jgi:phosphoribosylaminoimidazole-succinocarboxamide synthase
MALYESNLRSLKRIGRGKVRDIYAVDGDKMMIVVTDRLSRSTWCPDRSGKGGCSRNSRTLVLKLGVVPTT